MEVATCFVALGGDIKNTVYRERVTPAEYLVLASLHGGHDAILQLTVTGDQKIDDGEELTRLRERYTRKPEVVAGLFPGHGAKLPAAFAAVMPQDGSGGASLVAPKSAEDAPLAGEADIIG